MKIFRKLDKEQRIAVILEPIIAAIALFGVICSLANADFGAVHCPLDLLWSDRTLPQGLGLFFLSLLFLFSAFSFADGVTRAHALASAIFTGLFFSGLAVLIHALHGGSTAGAVGFSSVRATVFLSVLMAVGAIGAAVFGCLFARRCKKVGNTLGASDVLFLVAAVFTLCLLTLELPIF